MPLYYNDYMKLLFYYILSPLAILLFSQCTLDRINGSSSNLLTEADLQAATLIIGESLSANNSGVFLSVQDALAIISQSGFRPKQTAKNTLDTGYDQITDYNSSYNRETGVHTVTFRRVAENNLKIENDTLLYVYRDSVNNFVNFPQEQQSLIRSINYSGIKQGTIQSNTNFTTFRRENDFAIAPISVGGSIFPIEGAHFGSGYTRHEQPDLQENDQYYELSFQFLNVSIFNEYGDRNQHTGFSLIGGLSWELKSWETPKKTTAKFSVNGTITLGDNDTALIRFNGSSTIQEIDINTGKPIDSTKSNKL